MQIAGHLNPVFRQLAGLLPKNNFLRRGLSAGWKKLLSSLDSDVRIRFHGEKTWVVSHWRSLDPNYEAGAVKSFLLSLQQGDTFWDVGSHIGLYSLLAARKVGPLGKVVAWEPSPQAFAHLNRHLKLNAVDSFCDTFQEVINDGAQREVEFAIDQGNEASATNQIFHAGFPTPGRTIKLAARSLDEWAESLGYAPHVLKMDIEGGEMAALEGASRIARGQYGRRPRILLSVHPASIHQYGRTCDELAAWVKAHGYGAFTFAGEPADLSEFGEVWLVPTGNRFY